MVTGKTTVWQLCMGQWTMWKLGSRWNCDNAMFWSRAAAGEGSQDSLDRKKPIICAAPPALAIIGLVSHRPGVGPELSPCCRQLWWNVILALARHKSSLILVYLVTILDTVLTGTSRPAPPWRWRTRGPCCLWRPWAGRCSATSRRPSTCWPPPPRTPRLQHRQVLYESNKYFSTRQPPQYAFYLHISITFMA